MTYDVIGDVHGTSDKLDGLLDLLGWHAGPDGERRHEDPDRQVVFVGDLIDRGVDHHGVLRTARSMVESGAARIVMGNHEFNAVCYATPDPDRPGEFLRRHTDKNRRQHEAFLTQLTEDERADWLSWFATLPLWLDLGGLRIVHACWHRPSMEHLLGPDGLGGDRFPPGPEGWARASREGDPTYEAVEVLLKGPEVDLAPYGLGRYLDKEGHSRGDARARWWRLGATTLDELIDIPPGASAEDGEPYPSVPAVAVGDRDRSFAYGEDVPVVYGHYWRQWEPSEHDSWTARTACTDFSAVRGGPLVAYRWRGERQIDPSHYVRFPTGRPAVGATTSLT